MALSLSGSYARKYRTIPGLPSESKVVTLTFQPAAICAPRTCLALNPIADLFNWRGPGLLLIVWFAHDRGFIGPDPRSLCLRPRNHRHRSDLAVVSRCL